MIAGTRNHQRILGLLPMLAGILCLAVITSGCAGLPLHSVPTEHRGPAQGDRSVTPPANQKSAAPQSTAAATAVSAAPPTSTNPAVIIPTEHTSATTSQAVQPSSNEVAQVGFRRLLHVGDGQCPPGNANAAQPHGYAMPMMVPQPWLYDPQEFLCDGGDHDPRAALTQDDRIIGLQPEDTVTHYTTEAGDIEFTASNRVCVYSPRFGNVRRITGAIQGDGAVAVSGVIRPVGPQGINYDLPGLVVADAIETNKAEYTRRIDSMRDRNRGVRIENIQQPLLAANVLDALSHIQNVSISELDESLLALLQRHAVAANVWTLEESVEVEIQDLAAPVLTRDQNVDALVVYDFPDAGRLNLIKLADKQHAAIGDTVTFALRLQNVGDSAVSGVVVTDNLTTRLEYIADSQTVSTEADFETKLNSASSSQLIWRLKQELAVGDSVTIEFKCRVR